MAPTLFRSTVTTNSPPNPTSPVVPGPSVIDIPRTSAQMMIVKAPGVFGIGSGGTTVTPPPTTPPAVGQTNSGSSSGSSSSGSSSTSDGSTSSTTSTGGSADDLQTELALLAQLFGGSGTASTTPQDVVGLPVQQGVSQPASSNSPGLVLIVMIVVGVTLYVLYKKGYLKKVEKDV